MTIEEVGLIDAAEIAVEVSDAGLIGTFEIEYHGSIGKFTDELVEEKMVGRGITTHARGGGMDEIETVGVAQE